MSRGGITVLIALIVLGCGSDGDGTGLDILDVAGSYEATTFIAFADSGEVDVLEEGGHLELVLRMDGTTAGTLFVPDISEVSPEYMADLSGSWRLTDDIVTLDHPADTFLRDVEWAARGSELVFESKFARVVLRQYEAG